MSLYFTEAQSPWNELPECLYPTKSERKETITKISDLINELVNTDVQLFFSKKENIRADYNSIKSFIQNAYVIVNQTTLDRKKLIKYNSSLKENEDKLCKFYKYFSVLLRIQEELKKLQIQPTIIRKVTKIYFQYYNSQICLTELIRKINLVCNRKDCRKAGKHLEFRKYTDSMINFAKERVKKFFKSNNFRLPTEDHVCFAMNDCEELLQRLESYFPNTIFLNSDPKSPIPELKDEKAFMKLLEDLMNVSITLLRGIYKDSKKWTQDNTFEKPTQDNIFANPENEVSTTPVPYLYEGFLDVLRAYRFIATLDERVESPNLKFLQKNWQELFFIDGTKQSEWRHLYNYHCKKVIDFIGKDNLKKADLAFALWSYSHDYTASVARNKPVHPT